MQIGPLLKQHKPGREGGFAEPGPPPIPCAHAQAGPSPWTRTTSTPASASRRTTTRRSPTCSARASTTRRSATPRRIAGRIISRRPFTPLRTPLARARVAIITTAAPYQPDKGDQGPGARLQRQRQVLPGLFRRHGAATTTCASPISATTASTPRATDSGTWFPLPALRRAVAAGRIGAVDAALPRRAHQPQPPRHHRDRRAGNPAPLPGRRRGRRASWCRTARSATRPCSLVARHLEANGIPTVVMGCAKDIVEHAAVPRFLFSDFPLGNSAGKPHDIGRRRTRRWNWRCACWKRAPGRAPRCNRRCAGRRER